MKWKFDEMQVDETEKLIKEKSFLKRIVGQTGKLMKWQVD